MIIAGLINSNSELFADGDINYAVIGGKCLTYPEFPLTLIQKIDASITADQSEALDEMQIFGSDDRRNKWISCNLGNLDAVADHEPSQQTMNREVVICSKRGTCAQEGKLCLTTKQASGLTNRQIEVLTLIGKKFLDKEIASILSISVNTVPVFTRQLREKTGCARKADLALYAQQLNLL